MSWTCPWAWSRPSTGRALPVRNDRQLPATRAPRPWTDAAMPPWPWPSWRCTWSSALRDGDSIAIGLLNVPSGSINVVPGRCLFHWTCVPHRRPARCNGDRRAGRTGQNRQRRGLRYTIEESMRAAAAPSAPAPQHHWERAVDALGVPAVFRMPSGAGHDAMKLHEIMPQAMLFTRGQNSGISHNPPNPPPTTTFSWRWTPSPRCHQPNNHDPTEPPRRARRLD